MREYIYPTMTWALKLYARLPSAHESNPESISNAVTRSQKYQIHMCPIQCMPRHLRTFRTLACGLLPVDLPMSFKFYFIGTSDNCPSSNELTHRGRVTHLCVGKLDHHWIRWWLVVWLAPSHYLNQFWNIINWTLRNKPQWNFSRNS